jgi:putative ABC transport system ATP-binding protein
MEPGLAVDVKGLTRIYPGPVAALAGVDLEVAYGEMVAITGPSGCGKSTLLHLLAAIDTPTSGSVVVAGKDLAHVHDLSAYRREEVGLVFQFHNLLPQLSALANVELAMFGARWSAHQRRTRARELLAEADLADRERRLPTELSGGERQRVAIARALANEPKILLADEPTGSLDSASTGRFLDLLSQLSNRGVTIVMVTHAPDVAAHADRVVEMCDGKVVDEGEPLRTPSQTADTDGRISSRSDGRHQGPNLLLRPDEAVGIGHGLTL